MTLLTISSAGRFHRSPAGFQVSVGTRASICEKTAESDRAHRQSSSLGPWRHRSKRLILAALVFAPAFTGCGVGQRHTSDAELLRNFLQHKNEFRELAFELQNDVNLTMIDANHAEYSGYTLYPRENTETMERAGLTRIRWERYQRLLRDLRLVEITKTDGGIELRVDQGSFSNGDSYKGYEYSASLPEHPKPSLDNYRISDADRDSSGAYYACRPIDDHWRIYIYVNS